MTSGTASGTTQPITDDLHLTTGGPAHADEPDASEPPSWLRVGAFVPAAGVLAFGAVGLLLAIHGVYSAAVAFPLGALGLVAMTVLAWPAFRSARPASRSAHVAAAVGVTAILAITAWNGVHNSQHVLINRDGGSYLTTGRWIARDGSLEARPRVGGFANDRSLQFNSFAVFDMPDGTVQFQFAHLLPAVLAESYDIGGDRAMTHAPELLGGISLLAFFVLAWRLLKRPWFALAAVLTLAFSIPQVSFSRDSYSEIPSQLLLFTALWLVTTKKVLPTWRVALAAGLFVGMMQAVRIDALVFVIGVPVLLAVAWLAADPEERQHTRASIIAFAAGLVPGIALGLTDLVSHSGRYWSDLRGDVKSLGVITVLTAVAMGVLVAVWKFVVPLLRRLRTRRIATGAAILLAITGFAVWAFRPSLQHVHGNGQSLAGYEEHEGVKPDATRLLFERSMTWMSWYLGPILIAAAIIGGALLVRSLVLEGRFARVTAALATLVPASALYLWKANAAADHIWVMRRFLVGAFPLFVLLAVGLAAYLWPPPSTTRRRVTRSVVSLLLVAGSLGWPLYTVAGLQAMTEQRGYLNVVRDACAHMGPKPAVVLIDGSEDNIVDLWLPQTLRGWCGADVAILRAQGKTPAETRAELTRLADAWHAQGRRLFATADNWGVLTDALPGVPTYETPVAVNNNFLERTVTYRPRALIQESFAMLLAEVPHS